MRPTRPTSQPKPPMRHRNPLKPTKPKRRINWSRVFAFGVLPAAGAAAGAGRGLPEVEGQFGRATARSHASSRCRPPRTARSRCCRTSPTPWSSSSARARDLLTGDFRDSYTSLTNDVVIPGAKQKQISAVATVPAVASVSADPRHAVVLVFVNQTVIVGTGRADRHRVQCAGDAGQGRRPLADLQVRPGVSVTATAQLARRRGAGRAAAGADLGAGRRANSVVPARFPRHRLRLAQGGAALVDAGWRVVAPFMRGYAPSSLPSDGSYHVGALMDDALRVLDAAGPTGRDVFIGHDWGAIAGAGLAAMPDSPFTKAVIMSVPRPRRSGRSSRVPACAPGWPRNCRASCFAAGTSCTSNCPGCQSVPRRG